jgi:hypothetical protein
MCQEQVPENDQLTPESYDLVSTQYIIPSCPEKVLPAGKTAEYNLNASVLLIMVQPLRREHQVCAQHLENIQLSRIKKTQSEFNLIRSM